jgi:hypothetical protein
MVKHRPKSSTADASLTATGLTGRRRVRAWFVLDFLDGLVPRGRLQVGFDAMVSTKREDDSGLGVARRSWWRT